MIYYPNWRIKQIYDEFVPFLKTFYSKEVEIYRYFGKSKFAGFWEQVQSRELPQNLNFTM